MFDIQGFWANRLKGAESPVISKLPGWVVRPKTVNGFVEPNLSLVEGNPDSAKIFILSAPGAVGKSCYAAELASRTGFSFVDLALTSPLGGNFFTGGMANAFGFEDLSLLAQGKRGLIVDALDEAQLRATPEAFEAGLKDLVAIAGKPSSCPIVLLGRAVAAEEAFLLLLEQEIEPCLLKIEFFTDKQAFKYIENKIEKCADRDGRLGTAYENFRDTYLDFAKCLRAQLMSLKDGSERNFAGYAPVLDAICECTMDADDMNIMGRLQRLNSDSQIGLIQTISDSILDRERGKLLKQLSEQVGTLEESLAELLYQPEEQLQRLAASLFGEEQPILGFEMDPEMKRIYNEMVDRFLPQHPFLDGGSGAANLVFKSVIVLWALTTGGKVDQARRTIRERLNFESGLLFEMYAKWLSEDAERTLTLEDVGLLFTALASQISARQRPSLEIYEEGEDSISVRFEIVDAPDTDDAEPIHSKTWGPFKSNSDTTLRLRAPFSNVFIDAPIMVELGDGESLQIGAPTSISAKQLVISAKSLSIHSGSGETLREHQVVSLEAEEVADIQPVQNIIIRDRVTTLAVSWPEAKRYPWVTYFVEMEGGSPDINFIRRRMRKILTAFRSHSKGRLVRLADKIDSLRMRKDARGTALIDQLLQDGILSKIQGGKFYMLDPDLMAEHLGTDYHAIQQQQFNARTDAYLERVLAGIEEE